MVYLLFLGGVIKEAVNFFADSLSVALCEKCLPSAYLYIICISGGIRLFFRVTGTEYSAYLEYIIRSCAEKPFRLPIELV